MDWASVGADSQLAALPSYVNIVLLSFYLPDATYAGGVTLEGTGLDFSSDAGVIKDAIAALKTAHPSTKVLVSVGGAKGTGWNDLNVPMLATFVQEFGLDGVDIDYEPTPNVCTHDTGAGTVSCSGDEEYTRIVSEVRAALPRPAILSAAVWSTGAYGLGQWAAALPMGNQTGMAINMLDSVGDSLDFISIMAYDAGVDLEPATALAAYRSIYSGTILVGMEVANEAWGGNVITLDEVTSLGQAALTDGNAGLMLWSLQKSWSMPWVAQGVDSQLAALPSYVNIAMLSFYSPNATYAGGVTLEGTGFQFSSNASVILDAIAALKVSQPGTKILVSVGGSGSSGWKDLNATMLATFVQEFGLHGVDIDYEPSAASCTLDTTTVTVSCTCDEEYAWIVSEVRAALPRPAILSAAVWSTGAYGLGQWAEALPMGDQTGMAINMLDSVGDSLDFISIMAYDAGTTYVPSTALQAYRSYYNGTILLGMEVADEAWGGHVITLDEVTADAEGALADGDAGLMLWSLQKSADQGPTATEIAQAACQALGLGGCDVKLP